MGPKKRKYTLTVLGVKTIAKMTAATSTEAATTLAEQASSEEAMWLAEPASLAPDKFLAVSKVTLSSAVSKELASLAEKKSLEVAAYIEADTPLEEAASLE